VPLDVDKDVHAPHTPCIRTRERAREGRASRKKSASEKRGVAASARQRPLIRQADHIIAAHDCTARIAATLCRLRGNSSEMAVRRANRDRR